MKGSISFLVGKKIRNDPLHKTIPSKLFNFITSLFTGVKIHDFNCGFKLYRKEVVKNLFLYGEMHRYIPVLSDFQGFRVSEIAVKHHPRKYGSSKYGFERFTKGFYDFLTIYFLIKFQSNPLHFFGTIGSMASSIGMGILIYLTAKWFMGISIGGRPLFILGIIMLVLGICLFLFGFISELIIFLDQKREMNSQIKSHIIKKIVKSKKQSL